MNNPRISAKERGLLKGAIRRTFSRSDLRRQALAKSIIPGFRDATRPRVTKWAWCCIGKHQTPAYLAEVDHKIPVVPLGAKLEEMTWDDLVDRLWCTEENLQVLCQSCHKIKSKEERAARKHYDKLRKETKK